ncbi:DUF3465 domain-containing protein [Bdellovibrio reynosensis]|uniref:DUF3465 domain-containing protein n=1 Tax=Bdellovibrio reynosensis TaxID=2835041 RepID=A0ABY4CDE5_9BACT|nr:DUF3465 domain-containing protein [Bdellovibrio reynosensis]UOF02739.1 DUF3465 domain-containing protein [Bdellovibrio reynosensis]
MTNLRHLSLYVLTVLVGFSSFNEAHAKRKNKFQEPAPEPLNISLVDDTASDTDIVRAVNDRRRVNFVEGGSLTVVKVLPDDRNGREHQKWVVRLSNGQEMQAVYNSDMCPRVPVKAGDVIAMGGEFIWTNKGPLLHWLHGDPRGNRTDGYVYLKGTYYCKDLN